MTYLIYSDHNVYVDDFKEGEKEHVNFYENNAQVDANSVEHAIELYISEKLFYTFKKDSVYIDEDINRLFYDVLVDNDQQELTKLEREQWKKGEFKAYANRFELQVYKLKEVKTKNIKF